MKNTNWQLLEIVQVQNEFSASKEGIPLQLFKMNGNAPEENTALWFTAGSEGSSKADAFIMSLFQKALSKGTFVAAPDLYMTPVINPTVTEKSSKSQPQQKNQLGGFTTSKVSSAETPSTEVSTLMRWNQKILPKAIISFSSGTSMIRHMNAPEDIIRRLSELSERAAFAFGTEPEVTLEDGTLIPRDIVDASLGQWCVDQGVVWIDFCMNGSIKTFDEVAQVEWRSCVGPALKWLVEGLRFNPPKEEPAFPKLQVIPVLEMPPEFANL